MTLLEILVIIFASLVVIGVIVAWIIRKKQGKPSCGCDCSSCSMCSRCKNTDKPNDKTQQ